MLLPPTPAWGCFLLLGSHLAPGLGSAGLGLGYTSTSTLFGGSEHWGPCVGRPPPQLCPARRLLGLPSSGMQPSVLDPAAALQEWRWALAVGESQPFSHRTSTSASCCPKQGDGALSEGLSEFGPVALRQIQAQVQIRSHRAAAGPCRGSDGRRVYLDLLEVGDLVSPLLPPVCPWSYFYVLLQTRIAARAKSPGRFPLRRGLAQGSTGHSQHTGGGPPDRSAVRVEEPAARRPHRPPPPARSLEVTPDRSVSSRLQSEEQGRRERLR